MSIEYNPRIHYVFATATGYKIVDKQTNEVLKHVGTKAEVEEHEKIAKGKKIAEAKRILAEEAKQEAEVKTPAEDAK